MNYKRVFLKLLFNKNLILCIWIIAAIAFSIQGIATHRYNNYLIFEYSFFHLIKCLPLYLSYPTEYHDAFHSGPLFAVLMAPFAVLPDWLGLITWNLVNTLILFFTIQKLPIKETARILICWLAIPDIIASTLSEQFNPLLAVFILMSFILIKKGNLFWGAFFIVAGTLMKLYGIVGLAFFFFTPNRFKLALYLIFWTVILFALPMLFSSPQYILNTYVDWYAALTEKNNLNTSLTSTQDLSVMGLFRRILLDSTIPTIPFLIVAIILFGSAYVHFRKFKSESFQLMILVAALISPVIFSTGSEDVTYIIAIIGAGIYFVTEKNHWWRNLLLVLTILVSIVPLWTILPLTLRDQFPFVYVFKVIPFLLVWVTAIISIHFSKKQSDFRVQ